MSDERTEFVRTEVLHELLVVFGGHKLIRFTRIWFLYLRDCVECVQHADIIRPLTAKVNRKIDLWKTLCISLWAC